MKMKKKRIKWENEKLRNLKIKKLKRIFEEKN